MKLADHKPVITALYFYKLFWQAMDWIYPPYCGGCGNLGDNWCQSCQKQAILVPDLVCQICGDVIPKPGLCKDCAAIRPFFNSARSWSFFDGPVRNILHSLKYKQNIGLGYVLAFHLAETKIPFLKEFDIIIPVPLSRERFAERGYNQAAMLAFPLSLILQKKYQPGGLKKVLETKTQVGLNIQERQVNIKNAFHSNPKIVKGKSILLIDDVMTTGATLNECGRALLSSGAIEVNALTLARTRFKDNIN